MADAKNTLFIRAYSFAFFAVILLFLISCTKKITSTTTEETIERIRPVPYGFPPSISSFDVTIECDKKTNLPKPLQKTFKVDKKKTTATIAGNNLNIENKTDTVVIYLPCKDVEKSKDTNVKKVVTVWPWWVVPLIIYSIIITVIAIWLLIKRLFP